MSECLNAEWTSMSAGASFSVRQISRLINAVISYINIKMGHKPYIGREGTCPGYDVQGLEVKMTTIWMVHALCNPLIMEYQTTKILFSFICFLSGCHSAELPSGVCRGMNL